MQENGNQLSTGLKARHMRMIAIGGVIGAGLFVGSGVVIKSAGPAAILSFLLTGILVILMMKMLGDIVKHVPGRTSFYDYVAKIWEDRPETAKLLSFLTGWMYWYFWVIVIALEVIACAELLKYWAPDEPTWLLSISILATMTFANLYPVKIFGEFEFWFSSLKVLAIVLFLITGTAFLAGFYIHAGRLPVEVFSSWSNFAPNGVAPILTGAVSAMAFYFGVEIVVVAARETAETKKAVAKATSSVVQRVLLFYVFSIAVVVCIISWDSSAMGTPFVSALNAMGIPYAGHVMNAVILVAVLSALNSSIYASSRMLLALTQRGVAPKFISTVSPAGVPFTAVIISTLGGYLGVLASYVSPDKVFSFIVNSYGTVAIFVYLILAVSYVAYFRSDAYLSSVVGPFGHVRHAGHVGYVTITGMLSILVAMAFIPDQRIPLLTGVGSVGILLVAYFLCNLKKPLFKEVE